ncbi:MAG TPA: oligosaccharide flippase family protein [Mariniphaga sp.]|nr:oligosaccharide flippase family protein [Mariniphaga sp.]
MKRKFITNLILLLFLNLLVKPFWIFGIDRTVQNVVGDENYGFYFALFNFSLILNILLDVGITSFNNRNIAQHNFLLSKHFSYLVSLKLLLAIAYTIVSLLIASIIGYNKLQIQLLLFLIFNQFLASFILYLRSNISALHLFRTDSLISVLDRTLMIAICSFLLFNNFLRQQFSIQWFVYAQTASYSITALITFFIVLRKSGRFRITIKPAFYLVFLRKSYPYAILILLMALYNRIDSVMLERMLPGNRGQEQAGIYAQAFRLMDAISMVGVLFAGLLLPIFAKMIKQNQSVVPMVKLSYTLIMIPAIFLAVTSIYYDEEIMSALYTTNTIYSSNLLGILMIGYTGIATTYIFGTLLTANGSLKYLNIMAFTGMIINVSLNIILIPRLEAYGSAYASMITQLFTGGLQLIMALYIFKFKLGFKYILQLLFFTVIVFALAHFTQSIEKWLIGYIISIAGSAVAAFLLRLISIKGMLNILMYK